MYYMAKKITFTVFFSKFHRLFYTPNLQLISDSFM